MKEATGKPRGLPMASTSAIGVVQVAKPDSPSIVSDATLNDVGDTVNIRAAQQNDEAVREFLAVA